MAATMSSLLMLLLLVEIIVKLAVGENDVHRKMLSHVINGDQDFKNINKLVFVTDNEKDNSSEMIINNLPWINLVLLEANEKALSSIPHETRIIVVELKKESSMEKVFELLPLVKLDSSTHFLFITKFVPNAFDLSYNTILKKFWYLSFSHLVWSNSSTYGFW